MKLKPGQRDENGRLFIGYRHRYWSDTFSMSTVMPTAKRRGGPYKHFAHHRITRLFRKEGRYRKALRELVDALWEDDVVDNGAIGSDAFAAMELGRKLLEET